MRWSRAADAKKYIYQQAAPNVYFVRVTQPRARQVDRVLAPDAMEHEEEKKRREEK